jgi:hypothetical protein
MDTASHVLATLSHYTDAQCDAIRLIYEHVKRHPGTGGSRAGAGLLLGLYNGLRFPFDLTDLRSFDTALFEAAMTVIRMDSRRTWCEVHVLLDAIYNDGCNTGEEFEHWAFDLRLKGRGTKENLSTLPHREIPRP